MTLRKTALSVGLTLAIVTGGFGQEVRSHQKTQTPADVRFELVQSALAAKITLKLDKFTGQVFQIVQTKGDDLVWEKIPRLPHKQDVSTPGRVNYQVFTSGLAVKFTFLMNVSTGATWQLLESKEQVLVWEPVP